MPAWVRWPPQVGAALLAVVPLAAAALAWAADAAADPAAEPTPAPAQTDSAAGPQGLVPTLTAIGAVLGQRGAEAAGPLGLPDLSGNPMALLLGQNPMPAPPGDVGPVNPPNLSAFTTDYLLPQNLTPAAPGQGSGAPGIGPDQDSPGTGRIAFLRRLHEMYAAGELKGALLGQLPKDESGQPILPVTSPLTGPPNSPPTN